MSTVGLAHIANNETVVEEPATQTLDQRMLGIMAAFAVTWGILCLISFVLSEFTSPEHLARQYTPEQLAYLSATPAWVGFSKAMTAIGLICGAVYLLLRKKSSYHWFMISLFGTLLTAMDSMFRDGFQVLGGLASGVNLGMIIVGVFLFWASYSAFYDGQLSE